MLEYKLLPFKNLETTRLLLRRLNENDLEEVYQLRSNPDTMKFVPRPLCKNKEEALAHIKLINDRIDSNEGINWAITYKDNPLKFIGIVGHYKIQSENYRSEIGYMILPEYNGKGITTEALNAVLIYGFEDLKLHSTEAIIDPENYASEKVLLKNGFVKEAHILENGFWNGKFLDTVIYSLLKRNFKKM